MNAFANPEDVQPFIFPEFPKPAAEITEYTNVDGVLDFIPKNLKTGESFNMGTDVTPIVQPVQLQDFRNFIQASGS